MHFSSQPPTPSFGPGGPNRNKCSRVLLVLSAVNPEDHIKPPREAILTHFILHILSRLPFYPSVRRSEARKLLRDRDLSAHASRQPEQTSYINAASHELHLQ